MFWMVSPALSHTAAVLPHHRGAEIGEYVVDAADAGAAFGHQADGMRCSPKLTAGDTDRAQAVDHVHGDTRAAGRVALRNQYRSAVVALVDQYAIAVSPSMIT